MFSKRKPHREFTIPRYSASDRVGMLSVALSVHSPPCDLIHVLSRSESKSRTEMNYRSTALPGKPSPGARSLASTATVGFSEAEEHAPDFTNTPRIHHMSEERGVMSPVPRERWESSPGERVAEMHLRSGDEAIQRGDYERAAAEYTYCIQLNPSQVIAFARRGDVWRILGRSEAAVADYSAYLHAVPTDEKVLLNRGQLYAIAGLHRLAAADFTAALAQNTTPNPTVYVSRGQARARLGEYPQAIDDFSRALELSPGNAFAHLERGTVYLETGDYLTAISDLTRALQLNPYLWLALSRRAEAHTRLGHHDRAVSDLTEALCLDPLNPGLFAARGEAQLRQGSPNALADYDEAVRLAPGNPEWRARRGLMCLSTGRLEQAEQDLSAALQIDPTNVNWLRARGEARLRSTQLDQAMTDYIEMTRLAPAEGTAYLGQALVYITRGDFGMALPYLDRAIDYAPGLAEAYYQRARCNHRIDQVKAALEDVNRAVELEPGGVLPRRLRAELFMRMGRAEEAYADLAELVARAPSDPIVYHLRGKLEFRRGRAEAAIADLTTALRLDPKFTEALADRAGVYRGVAKHKEALADLTSAVHQDAKFATEYLVQLGIVRGALGEFNEAIANFIVALQLDPTNKAAIRGKELVSQLRDAHGSPDQDSEQAEMERRAEAERALGGAGPKRPGLWRSTDVQRGHMPLALDAATSRMAHQGGQARALPGARQSQPGLVGIVLEPDQDVDLALAPSVDNTDFDLDGDFADEVDLEAIAPGGRGASQTDIELGNEPVAPVRPAKPRKKPHSVRRPYAEKGTSRKAAAAPARPAKKKAAPEPAEPAARAKPEKVVSPPPPPPPKFEPPKFEPPKPAPKPAAPIKKRWDDDDDENEGKFRKLINSKWGKRIILPLGLITMSYLVYDTFFDSVDGADIAAKAKKSAYPVAKENVFTADQLSELFAKDAAAARERSEVFVEVSGKVKKVTESGVELETPNANQSIVCEFPRKEDIPKLKAGDSVVIQGEGAKPNKSNIVLGVCKVKPR